MTATDLDRSNRTATSPPPVDARVVLRPLATPLSLGFLALAVASLTLSGLQLGWVDPATQWTTVGLVVLVFAVPMQAVSTVFGFLARDAIAATGLGVLTGVWLAIGVATWTGTPGQTSPALGLLLLGAGFVLLVPAVVGSLTKWVAAGVLLLASARFLVTGAYEMTGSTDWRLAAGAAGLLLSAAAVYAALAFEVEAAKRRTILPTGRRGRGREALAGTFREEIEGLQHEPGVRQQL
jgi:succinate-acetate transporter protein